MDALFIKVPFSVYRFAVRREIGGRRYSYVSAPVLAATGRPGDAQALLASRCSAFDTAPATFRVVETLPAGRGKVLRPGVISHE